MSRGEKTLNGKTKALVFTLGSAGNFSKCESIKSMCLSEA